MIFSHLKMMIDIIINFFTKHWMVFYMWMTFSCKYNLFNKLDCQVMETFRSAVYLKVVIILLGDVDNITNRSLRMVNMY